MAKKAATVSSINREDFNWGTRLTCRPFATLTHLVGMEITVDIHEPKPGSNADIRTRFSGVPFSYPLGSMDMVGWLNQMNATQVQAREIAAELKAKAAAPQPTKKAAKKAAKKS